MSDELWGSITVVVALIAGVIGYFIKRQIERTPTKEKLEIANAALDFEERLRRRGTSGLDVKQIIDSAFEGRGHSVRVIEEQVEKTLVSDHDENTGETLFMNQAELNGYSATRAEAAQIRLNAIVNHLSMSDKFDVDSLHKSQELWSKYMEAEATMVSTYVEGGTMQPLVYNSEKERLLVSRIAELEDFRLMLEELQILRIYLYGLNHSAARRPSSYRFLRSSSQR